MSGEEESQSISEVTGGECDNGTGADSDHERKNEGEKTHLPDPLEMVNAFFGATEGGDDTPPANERRPLSFGSDVDQVTVNAHLLNNFCQERTADGLRAFHVNQTVPKTINDIMKLPSSEWPTSRRVELDDNGEICLTRNGDERVLTPEEAELSLNRFRNFLVDAKEEMFEEPAAANTIQRFEGEPEQVKLSDHEYYKEAENVSKRSLTDGQSSGINGSTSPKSKAQRQAGKDDETFGLQPMATDLLGETYRRAAEENAVGNAVDNSGKAPEENPNDGGHFLRSTCICPICQGIFSKWEIANHAANCEGH